MLVRRVSTRLGTSPLACQKFAQRQYCLVRRSSGAVELGGRSEVRFWLLLAVLTSVLSSPVCGQVRYTQDVNNNTTALAGLFNPGPFKDSLCEQGIPFSGTVVKREFDVDAVSVNGFVVEFQDGSRWGVNVEIPKGLSMTPRDIVSNGLQRLLREGRVVKGTVSRCGVAGHVLILQSVR